MQMLLDAKPKYFLTWCVSPALAHGTDVWLGKCPDTHSGREGDDSDWRSVRRDDIMIYLIQQGLEEGLAFTIMEAVRRAKA